ncbi:MAG: flagellar basal body-associated FliL family protein, partial [Labilithrix sp.]|nr:flagellar basal body-associated FliL family protein [Labilithrix sp.]
KKPHPMKMSIAVEFAANTTEDLKSFVPRIRDAVLTYLRTVTHEQVTDPGHVEKMRADLLERCRAAGAGSAERILVTDFVVQ